MFADAIRFFGDRCFTRLDRSQIISFARHLAAVGLNEGGIQYCLYVLHAGVRVFIREYGLDIHNPFTLFRASEIWSRNNGRSVPDPEQLAALRAACLHHDDELRHILAMLIDTGARVGEIAGLSVDDVVLDSPIPYLHIRAHSWRGLKTPASTRDIPLIGVALWAAGRALQKVGPTSRHLFPGQFLKGSFTRRASSALGLWLSSRGVPGALISFRALLVERLRETGCPPDVRAYLLGWRLIGMENEYGIGYSHQCLVRWLRTVETPLPTARPMSPCGLGRRLSPYECGLKVVALIKKLHYPSFENLVSDGTLARADIVRGLRYARKYRSVEIVQVVPAPRAPAYRVTSLALQRTSASARPRMHQCDRTHHYDHRKLLLSLSVPRKLSTAQCFPADCGWASGQVRGACHPRKLPRKHHAEE